MVVVLLDPLLRLLVNEFVWFCMAAIFTVGDASGSESDEGRGAAEPEGRRKWRSEIV